MKQPLAILAALLLSGTAGFAQQGPWSLSDCIS